MRGDKKAGNGRPSPAPASKQLNVHAGERRGLQFLRNVQLQRLYLLALIEGVGVDVLGGLACLAQLFHDQMVFYAPSFSKNSRGDKTKREALV